MQVDINLFSPLDSRIPQKLPVSDPNLYEQHLEYAIIDEITNKEKAAELLRSFRCKPKNTSTEIIRDSIISLEKYK